MSPGSHVADCIQERNVGTCLGVLVPQSTEIGESFQRIHERMADDILEVAQRI